MKTRWIWTICAAALVCSVSGAAAALEPREIALVVNSNVASGAELARYYARQRGIPEQNIIALDLPIDEQLPFEHYDKAVVRPLRQRLEDAGLRETIRCVVTFHGVPLKIAQRSPAPEETEELESVKRELEQAQRRAEAIVERWERLAREAMPQFRPLPREGTLNLPQRAAHAGNAINLAAQRLTDPAVQQQLRARGEELMRQSMVPAAQVPATTPSTGPAEVAATAPAEPPLTAAQVQELMGRMADPAARARLRSHARWHGNAFNHPQLLGEQLRFLTAPSDAAFDSELALLWVDGYPRPGWQPNLLAYPYLQVQDIPHILMVTRLDAADPDAVRRIIDDSIAAEREGLKGKIVIDSRGIPAVKDGRGDAFGQFDERLRALSQIVQRWTKLTLVHDEKAEVLPPGSVEDVALYCGWYSVAQYVPSMKFVPGAVGYHIASYELTSLRDPANTGWGPGLLRDGVAVTIGPVSEPLLHAFPLPDDFFPLLLTGKLTLAEVYWRTSPLMSWKMCVIGDPLYTPFKSDPVLTIEQLPERLRPIFSDVPATQPAAAP